MYGKNIILICLSSKPKQEGIAILEVLPWCYKQGVSLIHIENIHETLSAYEKEDIFLNIKTLIDQNTHELKDFEIEFKDGMYLEKVLSIPIKYQLKTKN